MVFPGYGLESRKEFEDFMAYRVIVNSDTLFILATSRWWKDC
jgi:hypothetical protein